MTSPWAYQSPCLQALGLRFAVRVTDSALGTYLESVLGHLTVPGEPDHVYSLSHAGDPGSGRNVLCFDGDQVVVTHSRPTALAYLFWHVNRTVVATSGRYLLFHAAAAEDGDGTALIMPGPAEAGKTTLVTGLVRARLRYLSDEVAAVDPVTMLVHPYAKPLSIDQGSWPLFPDLEPMVAPGARSWLGEQWQVAPVDLGAGRLAPACRPGFVVVPTYRPGSRTALAPMSRSTATLAMARSSFNFSQHGSAGLATTAAVVRRCECYSLTIGNLAAACALVLELLGNRRRAPSSGPERRSTRAGARDAVRP